MTQCNCPRIDGFVVIARDCPSHPEARERRAAVAAVTRNANAEDAACAWSDYRKDYGVGSDAMAVAHKAFLAGWTAARQGDQAGVLR